MQKTIQNLKWLTLSAVLGIAIGGGLIAVNAWTEPTVAPPGGNIGAPINTSGVGQIKDGALQTNGLWNVGTTRLDSTLNIPTGAGAGKVLTSDVSGVATWQTGSGTPAGAIMPFYLSACPSGWILANGANGTPDLRGAFVRGMYGDQNGRDVAKTLGDYQGDAFQGHWHQTNKVFPNGIGGSSGASPLRTDGTSTSNDFIKSPVTDNVNGVPRTAIETRPKNVALIYCMKQ